MLRLVKYSVMVGMLAVLCTSFEDVQLGRSSAVLSALFCNICSLCKSEFGALAEAGEAYTMIGLIVILYSLIMLLEPILLPLSIVSPFIPAKTFCSTLLCSVQIKMSDISTPKKVVCLVGAFSLE